MSVKRVLKKMWWFLTSQSGFDPRRTYYSLRGVSKYVGDAWRFRKLYAGRFVYTPCLYDRYEEAGTTKGEYFWQDLLVARMIYQRQPRKHVDIGSRIDGFVAHVASFREIEVIDVRAVSTLIPGVHFKQADMMGELEVDQQKYCDSLSCLHALEHFGLGRYGDPLDPTGHEKGLKNFANLLEPGGILYLSTPIGQERVEFNANRVFNPLNIIKLAQIHHLSLESLLVVRADGVVDQLLPDSTEISLLSGEYYNLGIFTFVKH